MLFSLIYLKFFLVVCFDDFDIFYKLGKLYVIQNVFICFVVKGYGIVVFEYFYVGGNFVLSVFQNVFVCFDDCGVVVFEFFLWEDFICYL